MTHININKETESQLLYKLIKDLQVTGEYDLIPTIHGPSDEAFYAATEELALRVQEQIPELKFHNVDFEQVMGWLAEDEQTH